MGYTLGPMPSSDPNLRTQPRFIWLIILLPVVHCMAAVVPDCFRLLTGRSPNIVDYPSALDKSASTVKKLLHQNTLLRYDPMPGDDETLNHFELQYVFAPTFVRMEGPAEYVITRGVPVGYERFADLANGLVLFRRP